MERCWGWGARGRPRGVLSCCFPVILFFKANIKVGFEWGIGLAVATCRCQPGTGSTADRTRGPGLWQGWPGSCCSSGRSWCSVVFPRVPKPFYLGLLHKLLVTHPSPSGEISGGGARLACLAAACPMMLTWRGFFLCQGWCLENPQILR